MTQQAATSSLSLNGLRLSVFLGVYPEEKKKKQTVTVDAFIRFPRPPQACDTDQLEQTYCYAALIQYLKEQLQDKKFQLIENFTKSLYSLMKAYFPADILLSVRTTKQPSIPELTQGVTFEYGDEVTPWSS